MCCAYGRVHHTQATGRTWNGVASMHQAKAVSVSEAAVCRMPPRSSFGRSCTLVVSHVLDVCRMRPGILQEHHLPHLSPDVRADSWGDVSLGKGGRGAAGVGAERSAPVFLLLVWGTRLMHIRVTIPVFSGGRCAKAA